MKRFIRGAAVAVAILAPAVMSIAPANAATADVFTQIGGGSISPGLNATPQPQTFNFAGSGPAAGTDGAPATANCSASGNDAVGTLAIGEGNANITCSINSHTVNVNATYVRVGAVVVVVSAGVVQLGTGVCGFAPNGTSLPVTSYTLACGAAYVQAP